MLYYDRFYVSEGTDSTKSNKSRECMICHYWFFNQEFKFQYSGCYDLPMLFLNISNITIITVKC